MIEVLSSGVYSSIQDIGRFGFRKHGVPISGAMDQKSFLIANQLLGNQAYAASFEVYLHGLELLFHEHTFIAITGADVIAKLEGKIIPNYSRVKISRGNRLIIDSCKSGLFSYLAVQGGVISETVLKSQSFYTGITTNSAIKKGDQFPLFKVNPAPPNHSQLAPCEFEENEVLFTVFKGPEWDLIDRKTRSVLQADFFNVSQESSRMSYVLRGVKDITAPEISTSPVQPGTVQLMPSGKVAVLMRDAQTTGGYSRVLQLSNESVDRLSQVRPGKLIGFRLSK